MPNKRARSEMSGYAKGACIHNFRNAVVRIFGLCVILNGDIVPDKKPMMVSEKEWNAMEKWLLDGNKLIEVSFEDPGISDDSVVCNVIVPNAYSNIAYTRTVGGPNMKSTGKVAASTRSDWWRKCPDLGLLGILDVSTRPFQSKRVTKITFHVPRWIPDYIEKTGEAKEKVLSDLLFEILLELLDDLQFNALDKGAYAFRYNALPDFSEDKLEKGISSVFERYFAHYNVDENPEIS